MASLTTVADYGLLQVLKLDTTRRRSRPLSHLCIGVSTSCVIVDMSWVVRQAFSRCCLSVLCRWETRRTVSLSPHSAPPVRTPPKSPPQAVVPRKRPRMKKRRADASHCPLTPTPTPGKLVQIEYAINAVQQRPTALGIKGGPAKPFRQAHWSLRQTAKRTSAMPLKNPKPVASSRVTLYPSYQRCRCRDREEAPDQSHR